LQHGARLGDVHSTTWSLRSASGPGRRRATEQINHAYAMLVSSHFQGFCRDLHTEAAQSLVVDVPAGVRGIMQARLIESRQLDRGNPNPGNIGSDFARFGIHFWREVLARDGRNASRQRSLLELAAWRNAIAHQDFSNPGLRPGRLAFVHVRRWRAACDALARDFDVVLAAYLANLVGDRPW
jgi:hypothetical protein